MTKEARDLLLLAAIGAGATVIGCGLVTSWMRIVRHLWPSRTLLFSTVVGFLSITVLSILAYLILEH